jgi:hypothetical protein
MDWFPAGKEMVESGRESRPQTRRKSTCGPGFVKAGKGFAAELQQLCRLTGQAAIASQEFLPPEAPRTGRQGPVSGL